MGSNFIGIISCAISISFGSGYMINSYGKSDKLSKINDYLDAWPSNTLPNSNFPGVIYRDEVDILIRILNYTGIF